MSGHELARPSSRGAWELARRRLMAAITSRTNHMQAMTATRLDDLIGQVLDGKYSLEQVLGRGGMGVVFRAVHSGTKRTVAVKVIAPRFGDQAEFVERFRREAEAAGRLRHPNVVDVTDFGVARVGASSVAYLVMEYLDGCSLEEVLQQEHKLPLQWSADVLDQVCSAVEEAHGRAIVHRDLKPSNLWLEPDRRGGHRVKVLDFGLAKLADNPSEPNTFPLATTRTSADTEAEEPTLARPMGAATDAFDPASTGPTRGAPDELDEDHETRVRPGSNSGPVSYGEPSPGSHTPATLTRVGTTLGTPLYMSPEQARGDAVDARSDVYSLGVIAYRMLSGRLPFEGREAEVIRQHIEAPPPDLRSIEKRVPQGVSDLVMSALAKDPAARPKSAAAFGAAFVARAEGAAAVLQQFLGLYVGHFAPFARLMAMAQIPFMIGGILLGLARVLFELPPIAQRGSVFLLLMLFAIPLTVVGPLYDPIIAQLLSAPLRPVRVMPLLKVLRARARAYLQLVKPMVAFMAYMVAFLLVVAIAGPRLRALRPSRGMVLGVLLLGLVLPFLAYLGWFLKNASGLRFAGAIVLMEGKDAPQAMIRSAFLVKGTSKMLPGFELAYSLVVLPMVALGASVGLVAPWITRLPDHQAAWLFVATPLWSAPLLLLAPLPLIGGGLLYFKTRQALGEPLTQVLHEFEDRALPRDYWQHKLQERIRMEVESSR
jgi:serine/threonine protein kinase